MIQPSMSEENRKLLERTDLLRPIINIEYRTPQEVFDIMCDRFRRAAREEEASRPDPGVEPGDIDWAVARLRTTRLRYGLNALELSEQEVDRFNARLDRVLSLLSSLGERRS